MRRTIVASVAGALIVAVGAVFVTVHSTQSASPYAPSDADVNHDGRVNLADIIIVAGHYGHMVPPPTATTTPTTTATPTATATATPLFSYTAGEGLPTDLLVDVSCRPGDLAVGWGGTHVGSFTSALPVVQQDAEAWRLESPAPYGMWAGFTICLGAPAGFTTYSLSADVSSGATADVYCNNGDIATAWGSNHPGAVNVTTPISSAAGSGWHLEGSGGGGIAVTVVCLHGPTPLQSYVVGPVSGAAYDSVLVSCDTGDLFTGWGSSWTAEIWNSYRQFDSASGDWAWRFSFGGGSSAYLVCIDNAPSRAP